MAEIKFGTDGWRAVMCDAFILENVVLVAAAIAKYVVEESKPERGLIIGYDSRFFAEEFANACCSVFVEKEIPVYLNERPMPTPITAYAIKTYQAAGAIMLTASHNPARYNGIKFIPEYAGPATPEITKVIERNIDEGSKEKRTKFSIEKPGGRLVKFVNPVSEYINSLKKLVDFETLKKRSLKVVTDPMFGAGYGIIDQVLKEAGCKVTTIHNTRDPLFGGSSPDPSRENLRELTEKVKAEQAYIGLALDGDADRFGVVDSTGFYLSPNQVLSLLAVHLLKNRRFRGALVRTVATTHLLDAIASGFGKNLIETPVGFKYVGQQMLERNVVLGGEESGGLSILGHIPEKDGILANLLLAEVAAYEGKPLSSVLENIYKEYGYYLSERIDVEYPVDKKGAFLHGLTTNPPASIAGFSVEEVDTEDGVKFVLEEEDWLLVRPSGTESLIRCYIEAISKEKSSAEEKFLKLRQAVEELIIV